MLNSEGKELLNDIDMYLSTNNGARDLWEVLTALRGPDGPEDEAAKRVTTAVIRHKALPRTSSKSVVYTPKERYAETTGAVSQADQEEGPAIRQVLRSTHFSEHARNAFAVLGLKWEEVNVDANGRS
jgi:hypothetical protein